MKICLPTRDGVIDAHFGHCDHYTIYTIENNQIVDEETMASRKAAAANQASLLSWPKTAYWLCWAAIWAMAQKMY